MSEKQPWLSFKIPRPEGPSAKNEHRSEENRRKAQQPYDGPDRRHGADRRGMSFGLRFTTGRRLSEIEEWLDANCSGGGYNLAIEDMSEDLGRKTVRVMFDRDEDRQRFRDYFAGKKGDEPAA